LGEQDEVVKIYQFLKKNKQKKRKGDIWGGKNLKETKSLKREKGSYEGLNLQKEGGKMYWERTF